MLELFGNLWDFHTSGHWAVITTNGIWNPQGHAMMGRGTAKQAAERFPDLPIELGNRLKIAGNHVHVFSRYRIITFPVKAHWKDEADLGLIKESTRELVRLVGEHNAFNRGGPYEPNDMKVYLPRPGCGNGRLKWADVRPVIAPVLDDRFTVVWNGK